MKLNYYGYYIQEVSTGQNYLMSIEELLLAFCNFNNPNFKNNFSFNGKNFYLLNPIGNLYLFLQTNDTDIIKKIDDSTISVSEISDLLNDNERIAFAAYIYLKDKYLGMASPSLSPKITSFTNFVNLILQTIGCDDYLFNIRPLLQQTTREDVMKFDFLGKSSIQINRENSLFDSVKGMFSTNDNDYSDVASIEVIVKPKPRKNIKNAVRGLVDSVQDQGLEKMLISAKQDVSESLVDLYIEGSGVVHDIIDTKDEKLIFSKISDKVRGNLALSKELKQYEQNATFKVSTINSITDFNSVDTWSDSFKSIPSITVQ